MERDSKGRYVKGYTSSFKGKKHTEEALQKIRNTTFKKGIIPWNKGTKGIMKAWNKGKQGCFSEKSLKKMSISQTGHPAPKSAFKKGCISIRKGKKHSEETIKRMSEAHKKSYANGLIHHFLGVTGKNHPGWKGGKSFEPYPLEWTKIFRKQMRKQYNNICQLCEAKQNKEKLSIHHIDYDKKNIDIDNLIPLCRKCHGKTVSNREHWKELLSFTIYLKIAIRYLTYNDKRS